MLSTCTALVACVTCVAAWLATAAGAQAAACNTTTTCDCVAADAACMFCPATGVCATAAPNVTAFCPGTTITNATLAACTQYAYVSVPITGAAAGTAAGSGVTIVLGTRTVVYALAFLDASLDAGEAYEVRADWAADQPAVALYLDRVGTGMAPPALPIASATLANSRWKTAAPAAPLNTTAVVLSTSNAFFVPGYFWVAAAVANGAPAGATFTLSALVVPDPTSTSGRTGPIWPRALAALIASLAIVAVFYHVSMARLQRQQGNDASATGLAEEPKLSDGPPPDIVRLCVPVPPDALGPMPEVRLVNVSSPDTAFETEEARLERCAGTQQRWHLLAVMPGFDASPSAAHLQLATVVLPGRAAPAPTEPRPRRGALRFLRVRPAPAPPPPVSVLDRRLNPTGDPTARAFAMWPM